MAGMVAPFALMSGFSIFFLRQFFLSVPRDLEEAALLDGASHFTIFWRVILPLSTTPLATIATLTAIGAWNEFFWPFVVAPGEDMQVLPVALQAFKSQTPQGQIDWTGLMAASTITVAPTVALLLVFGRRVVEVGAVQWWQVAPCDACVLACAWRSWRPAWQRPRWLRARWCFATCSGMPANARCTSSAPRTSSVGILASASACSSRVGTTTGAACPPASSRTRQPDVFANHLSKFTEHVENGLLVDLAPLVARDRVATDQFVTGLYAHWGHEGRQYGMPADWDTVALLVNLEMTRRAGVPDDALRRLSWNPRDGGSFGRLVALLSQDQEGRNGLDPGFDRRRVKVLGYQTPASRRHDGPDGVEPLRGVERLALSGCRLVPPAGV